MLLMLVGILFFLIVFVIPKFWLSYSMKSNDKELTNMPFNAEEFGRLILEENNLKDVKIEESSMVDHYDLNDKTVRVQEGRLSKISLTSLTLVCHEIGHAIQLNEEYGPLVRRTNIV